MSGLGIGVEGRVVWARRGPFPSIFVQLGEHSVARLDVNQVVPQLRRFVCTNLFVKSGLGFREAVIKEGNKVGVRVDLFTELGTN